MAVETLISDLLPPAYDILVQKHTGKELLNLERESILYSLINTIRWTVLRRVREEKGKQEAPGLVNELRTSDRFASKWMSRLEVVDRIVYSSGLERPLAQLALLMVEMRVDLAMETGESLAVENVCEIKASSDDRRSTSYSYDIDSSYRRMSEYLLEIQEGDERSLVNWLRPRPAGRALNDAVEKIEVVASFRRPVSYNLKLSPALAYDRQALAPSKFTATAEFSLLPLPSGDPAHRFHWAEGKEECEPIDLTFMGQVKSRVNKFFGRH